MTQLLDGEPLAGLNDAQRDAVLHFEGPMLVLAGAGSGKTRVLTTRISRLIQHHGVDPTRILSVTFTNKAAGEMRDRIRRLLGQDPRGMWSGTFHAIGARILRANAAAVGRTPSFTIYDADDTIAVIKRVMEASGVSAKVWSPKIIASLISDAKNALVTPTEYASLALDPVSRNTATVYKNLEGTLRSANAVTFDDLLTLPVELLVADPALRQRMSDRFQFILVDEYQDTNRAQYKLIKLLGAEHGNVVVVGDDDQCLIAGTAITMADGTTRPIEEIKAGDAVMSGYGSGDFRAARVLRTFERYRCGEGVAIATRAGHTVISTPEHTHFAGFALGIAPQKHFTYLMRRDGFGFRIGTTQVYTAGQVKPVVGFMQRVAQEHGDALWIVGCHDSENEARCEEYILSLTYQIPTLPFVPRKRAAGAEAKESGGLVHDETYIRRIFAAFDTKSSAQRLLADRGLLEDYPHYRPRSRNSSRRNVVMTLCGDRRGARPMHRLSMVGNDEVGRSVLEELSLSVRPAKAGSQSWRHETAHSSYGDLHETANRIGSRFPLNVMQVARLGSNDAGERESSSLPFIPAASVIPGMAMFNASGGYDIVESVERTALDCRVYDLDIENTHNFVANGIVTHNSIYGWRGADIRNILDFEREFSNARVVRLEDNYRSTPNILEVANLAISANIGRKGKTLRATLPEGERVTVVATLDDRDEADWVTEEIITRMSSENRSARDFAILYRTNSQSRSVEDALRKRAVPYRLVGAVRFYDRREIRDLMAYLKLIANPADSEAFRRAVAVPKRGIGDTTIETLAVAARAAGIPMLAAATRPELLSEMRPAARSGLATFAEMIARFREAARTSSVDEILRDLVDALKYGDYLKADAPEQARDRIDNVSALIDGAAETVVDDGGEVGLTPLDHFLQRAMLVAGTDQLDPSAEAVTLMTLHNAKGLEFPVVFITGLEDALFPTAQSFDDPAKMEEERRLFYVGITRAEQKLYFTHAESRRRNGEMVAGIKSRFVKGLPAGMLEERATMRAKTSGRNTWSDTNRRKTYDVPAWRQAKEAKGKGKGWESESQDMPSFVHGERIRHATFGTGTILEVSGMGRDVKATIAFDDETVGRKTVKLAYTTLERE